MKKFITVITLSAIVCAIYLHYSTPRSSLLTNDTITEESETKALESKIQAPASQVVEKPFAQLSRLKQAHKQCEKNIGDFSMQVHSIGQIGVEALKKAFRSGATIKELLAYSKQYEIQYHRYDELVLNAKLSIERDKYQFTDEFDVVNNWQGLTVIDGFTAENQAELAKHFAALAGGTLGLSFNLNLKANITDNEILALIENNEHFNTYLHSPLTINGNTYISPSILFVQTAHQLDIDTFKQVVARQSFNVNDLAMAIKVDMPIDYLRILLDQVSTIQDMPIVLQGRHNYFANLADVAAYKHNVNLLKLLATKDVVPTNEPGFITGLDIAIMALTDHKNDKVHLKKYADKYSETINYLASEDYRAHGAKFQGGEEILFSAPNKRSFFAKNDLPQTLLKALSNLDLLKSSDYISPINNQDSPISKALIAMDEKQKALNDKSANCSAIRKSYLAVENFADRTEVYELVRRVETEYGKQNVTTHLRELDPALVNFWLRSRKPHSVTDSIFLNLLSNNKLDEALEYSATTPLTPDENDILLTSLARETEKFMPIWKARAVNTPVSSLMGLKTVPLATLAQEGFDFTLKDRLGNNFFQPAVLHSTDAVNFLLDKGYEPEFAGLILDPLDLLLEDSYQKKSINPNIELMIPFVTTLEPNHFSRIARIKKFLPKEYARLLKVSKRFAVSDSTELNRFRSNFN